MPSSSTRYRLPVPLGTEVPDGPGSLQALVTRLEALSLIERFADSTARDAAVTAPFTGQRCVLTSDEIVYRYDGAAWQEWESAWISYTSTVTGFTVGTGGSATSAFDYRYEGGRVRVRYNLRLGSSGASVAGNPVKFTLPVTAAPLAVPYMIYEGVGGAVDLAPASYMIIHIADADSVDAVRVSYQASAPTNISATAPFVWAAGDSLHGELVYDPA